MANTFAIIPAAFAATYPQLNALNIMRLHSPDSAILSAVIFNALIIVFLIPLALKGVSYKPLTASAMLRRNLWIYGLGGLLVPFIGIKVIDLLLTVCGRCEVYHGGLRPALSTFIFLLLITGGVYPR